MQLYLLFNSVSYLLFSIWCLIKPTSTANFLGYDFLNNSGKIEYVTVYAGMEFGFAIFLAICGFYPNLSLAGLIFCVCLYLGIMFTRTFCVLHYGNVSNVTYIVGGLEYALGIWGGILLIYELKKLS